MKLHYISKDDFNKLKEEDVLFITHPGRMGDEDGSTFIVKNGNSLICYRIEHWMYNTNECVVDYDEMKAAFKEWAKRLSKDEKNSK